MTKIATHKRVRIVQIPWMSLMAGWVTGLSAFSAASAQRVPALPRWSLSAKPQTAVRDDGTPNTQFGRIAGAARLTDGGLAIADSKAREIRRFDAEGRFVGLIARAGSGPGEVESVSRFSANGDTIAAIGMRSAMLFTRDGRFVRRAGTVSSFVSSGGMPFPSARTSDGRFLGRRNGFVALNPPSHVMRDTVALIVFHIDAPDQLVVGRWALGSVYAHFSARSGGRLVTGSIPMSGRVLLEASGDLAWATYSASDSLVRVDRQGRRRVFRLSALGLPPVPVSTREFQAARARAVAEAADESRKELAEVLYDLPRPARAPAVSGLVPGLNGELWLQRFSLDDTRPVEFVVLDAQGKPVAELALPPRSAVYEVGRDYVLLGIKDADDVEVVALFDLKRSP